MSVWTGPSGSAKTAALKVAAQELDIELCEWINPVDSSSFHVEFANFLSKSSSSLFGQDKRQVMFIEDHPNLFHDSIKDSVQSLLRAYSQQSFGIPLVIILSETKTDTEYFSVNSYIPRDLISSVDVFKFNPIAVTYIKKAIKSIVEKEGLVQKQSDLDQLSQGGDIRNAISNLQFLNIMGRYLYILICLLVT